MSETPAISLRGGRLIDPANGVDEIVDLHIAGGRVAAVGAAPQGFETEITLDVRGKVVCPGLIDLSARVREPGLEHKATIASETAAAAHAGITTLCCPPDTDPVIDTPAVATLIRRRAQRIGHARLIPLGALTMGLEGKQLSEMAALKQAGCPAMSNALEPITSTLVLRRALEYASTFDLPVMLCPEDPYLREGGCIAEGRVSTRLGLPGIPEAAETVAIARDAALAEQSGARIHFRGLSSGAGARMLGRLRYDNPRISADTAIHHLFLTEMDVDGFNALCHVRPPLRTTADRDALREAVARGTISALCSDHQPHEADAKNAPFQETAPGISGLDTLLPLTLKLVDEGVLDLPTAIARLTAGPADALGLARGRLNPGADADVCVFDPDAHWILSPDSFASQGHNSPFVGWEFRGRVTHTLLAGRLVHAEEKPS
ncbi:MAG TPA: dihydroorotase [Chromatiales bacterium]|nr:dihydroorotase [Chromatiales bacterium]